jgi:Sec-independent protein secretion pathway component TatC
MLRCDVGVAKDKPGDKLKKPAFAIALTIGGILSKIPSIALKIVVILVAVMLFIAGLIFADRSFRREE